MLLSVIILKVIAEERQAILIPKSSVTCCLFPMKILFHCQLMKQNLTKDYFIQKIYKEQIKEHNEVVQVGIGNICQVTTAVAANLLSWKQVDNNLENVKAAGPIDDTNCNDKDLSGDCVMGIGDKIHLSKKEKATWGSNKLVSKTIHPIVVRKSLCQKIQWLFPMQHIFWNLSLPNHQNSNHSLFQHQNQFL